MIGIVNQKQVWSSFPLRRRRLLSTGPLCLLYTNQTPLAQSHALVHLTLQKSPFISLFSSGPNCGEAAAAAVFLPLFSLRGNTPSTLSLNRENPAECSTPSSDRLQGWPRSHWQIGIISSLSILDQFVYQTVCLQLCIRLYIHVPSHVPVCECSPQFSFFFFFFKHKLYV